MSSLPTHHLLLPLATLLQLQIIPVQLQLQSSNKLPLNLDLVLIFHGEWPAISSGKTFDMVFEEKFRGNLLTELLKYFDLGSNKTRVAIVACQYSDSSNTSNWRLSNELSGDSKTLKSSMQSIQPSRCGPNANLMGPFRIVWGEIFNPATDDQRSIVVRRPRTIVLFTLAERLDTDDEFDGAQEIGAKMRKIDAPVFVAAPFDKSEESKPIVRALTGDDTSPSFDSKTANIAAIFFEWLSEQLRIRYCTSEEACFYADKTPRSKCLHFAYTPKVPLIGGDCTRGQPVKSSSKLPCIPKTKCDRMCDTLWPWDLGDGSVAPVVNSSTGLPQCGGKVCGTIKRVGSTAPWRLLRHCPNELECPKCPRTQEGAEDSAGGKSEGILMGMIGVVIMLLLS